MDYLSWQNFSFTIEDFSVEMQLSGRVGSVLTLRLLMSYIYGALSKARNANVLYIWTYGSQR